MKWPKTGSQLSLIAVLAIMMGCASSGNTQAGDEDLTLRGHLNQASGVTVTGRDDYTEVLIRGAKDFSGNRTNTQPLFVIDGTVVGRSFNAATTMLRPGEIASVRVYTPSEAGMWGGRGAYGVIDIKTKSAN